MDEASSGPSPKRSSSTKERVKSLGRGTKAKTKNLLHLNKHTLTPEEEATKGQEDDPYEEIRHDPAFDPSQLVSQKPSLSTRIAGGFSNGVKIIVHPQDAAKKLAASKAAIKDRPYLSEEADKEFLDAHDSLSRAKSSASRSNGSVDQEAVNDQRERVKKIEGLRQSRKVAWTSSRHFRRAIVFPKREFPSPPKEDYTYVDAQTGKRRVDWMAWLKARQLNAIESFATNRMGQIDYTGQPPFDREASSRFVERILIASSPWQTFFLSLRSLYLWEDPAKSRKWLAIWLLIWYLDYCVTFILVYCAVTVLLNRFRNRQVEEMRELLYFSALLQEHGSDWIDPFIESAGPKIQMQLSDFADTLESLNNFYDWRDPKLTWATLFWFLTAILLGLFTPSEYSIKIVSMCCIIMFFGSRYVAHFHPEFRHVVNAFNYIFWGIPNDADWSMKYLREKAQETRAGLIEKRVQEEWEKDLSQQRGGLAAGSLDIPKITKTTWPGEDSSPDSEDDDAASFHTTDSSCSILDGLDILSFKCSMHNVPGRLVIFSDGLHYQRTSPVTSARKEVWRRLWSELVEMEKIDPKTAGLVKTKGIRLAFADGAEAKLEHVRQRDKAFNCIIGFSGLQFQIVLPGAATGADHETFGQDNGEFGFKKG
ncbi:uncharacterized protein M437DRAFT_79226 [Aureobasidium melanogenum CBS 110374]|uniref:Uncharacterized protein n=1 Tax=Aureobasidium melanogenum (strain CBS 110374) TaxID=1043003 RepID=A0A074VGM2_AURM1|nr:uncharacterized protein M437DRAFT_79226 [Aureobasidium melanogenum CBS 110374]KEQ58124.1 hypothetical protein M437DRAFT_79226 [Aureobasidium melanogenum CBS 110374]